MSSVKNIKTNPTNIQSGTYRMGIIPSWLLTLGGILLMLKIKDMDVSVLFRNDVISNKFAEILRFLSHIRF